MPRGVTTPTPTIRRILLVDDEPNICKALRRSLRKEAYEIFIAGEPAEGLALLKQLYRRLARRFHPDLVLDETDRAYRTDMMMAINAAYAAGDLDALERLANEPDTISYEPRSPEELIAALQREVDHCRRRLAEISTEMTTLERHDSSRLIWPTSSTTWGWSKPTRTIFSARKTAGGRASPARGSRTTARTTMRSTTPIKDDENSAAARVQDYGPKRSRTGS